MMDYYPWDNQNGKNKGFTIVELIVSLGILLLLVVVVIFTLNPLKQINKSMDGRRLADLSAFTSVFETYYNDHQHFPASVPFGALWKEGNTIYMSATPQDPQGVVNNGGYVYLTDGSSTPQWGVIFSKLSNTNASANSTCELTPACAPAGYSASQWACKVFGTVNCSSLTNQSLPETTIVSQSNGTTSTSLFNQNPSNQSTITPTVTVTPTISISGSQTITYCHATGTDTWAAVSANVSTVVVGSNPYDIIPPFNYSCSQLGTCNYSGKNWNTDTNTLWLENCQDLYNADSTATLHGPDGSWCKNSNAGDGDFIRQTSCTDNKGTYASQCQSNADLTPGCRIAQTGPTLHQFTAGCLSYTGTTAPFASYGSSLVCSNLNQSFPGTSSVCSIGMCTGLPSSNLTPPSNIALNFFPNFAPVGGNIKANTTLDILPQATDSTHLVGIRMITVSINGEVICRRLPPQVAGCIWNVPSSIPANSMPGNKIDIKVTAISGEGATASQDFIYSLVQ